MATKYTTTNRNELELDTSLFSKLLERVRFRARDTSIEDYDAMLSELPNELLRLDERNKELSRSTDLKFHNYTASQFRM